MTSPFLRPNLRNVVRIDSADTRGDFVRLDRNERVDPLTEAEQRALFEALRPEHFTSYPDPKPLQDRLATAAGLEAGWALVTNGSDAAIRRLLQACIVPGSKVLFPDPTYEMYGVYSEIFEAEATRISYPASRHLGADAITTAIIEVEPRIICLVNPDQPTGSVLDPEQLEQIVAAAASVTALVLVDEAYWRPGEPSTTEILRKHANLAVVRSFSKALGFGGIRLGVLYAQPPLIEAAIKTRGLHEVNGIALSVGQFLLDNPHVIDRYVATTEAGRELLRNFSRKHNFGFPPCPATFQLISLPPTLSPRKVADALKSRGWLIKAGFKSPAVSDCLRVSLAGPDTIGRFIEAFEDVLGSSKSIELERT